MRLISPAIGGMALGIGLAIGSNVSGGVLAGYGAALAVALVLMSRSSDGFRRARRGLELTWDAPGLSPDARRLARLKIVGSTLILLLLLVALAGELA